MKMIKMIGVKDDQTTCVEACSFWLLPFKFLDVLLPVGFGFTLWAGGAWCPCCMSIELGECFGAVT